MKWEIRTPEAWTHLLGREHSQTFCATTPRGEYSLDQAANGKFSVSLKGVAITGFTYETAPEAMEAAQEHDKELEAFM